MDDDYFTSLQLNNIVRMYETRYNLKSMSIYIDFYINVQTTARYCICILKKYHIYLNLNHIKKMIATTYHCIQTQLKNSNT